MALSIRRAFPTFTARAISTGRSMVLTFMSVSGIKLPDLPYMKHVKGAIVLTLLGMVGVSIYFNIAIGKEWWSLLGAVTAFLYGSVKDSD